MKQHSFCIEHAEKYGVKEAVFINNLLFWLDRCKANKANLKEGRYWVYNSQRAWHELFPYMSIQSIKTTLNSLLKQEVIIKGRYNKEKRDRTNWYTFHPSFTQDYSVENGCQYSENQVQNEESPLVNCNPSTLVSSNQTTLVNSNQSSLVKTNPPLPDSNHTDSNPDSNHIFVNSQPKVVDFPNTDNSSQSKNKSDKIDVHDVVDIYHQVLPDLPRIIKVTDPRRKRIQKLIKSDLPTLAAWREYFETVSQSDFLMGRSMGANWSCDFEWLIKPGNVLKVAEGRYRNRFYDHMKDMSWAEGLD